MNTFLNTGKTPIFVTFYIKDQTVLSTINVMKGQCE